MNEKKKHFNKLPQEYVLKVHPIGLDYLELYVVKNFVILEHIALVFLQVPLLRM